MLKKSLSGFLASVTAAVLLSATVSAVSQVSASGSCGLRCGEGGTDSLSWELSSDGILSVSGTGCMQSYEAEYAPWESCRKSMNCLMIGSGVKNIGGSAFAECENIRTAVISKSVASIDSYAFQQCFSLESVSFQEGLKVIDDCAFWYCRSLESIVFPKSMEKIGFNAFVYCEALREVVIQEGAECIIAENAFRGCSDLERITLPKNVVSIGKDAFLGCPDAVIFGHDGTVAEDYAKVNDITFVSLDKPSEIIGDINGDYYVDALDLDMLHDHIVGLISMSDDQISRSDTNADGIVDIKDYIMLYKMVFLKY